MNDKKKTKGQLIDELKLLRKRVAELGGDESTHVSTKEARSASESVVTESKGTKEALKISDGRFVSLFDDLRDGLLLADRETKKFLRGNKAISEVLGYTPEDLNHLGVPDIHPEEALPSVIGRFEELVRREISVAKDIPVRRKDGSIIYADISSSSPIIFDNKECFVGVFRDVTERKQTEDALRESRALLAAILESIPFEIWAIGLDDRYILINSAVKKHYGNVVGKRPEEVCPNDQILSIWKENNRRAFSGELVDGEVHFIAGDKEELYHNIIAPIYDGNEIRGILGLNIDIAERKRMEIELRKAHDELEMRVRERTADLEQANEMLRAEIAKRKQIEEALLRSEKKYRTMFENASEGMFQTTPEGRYLSVNPAFLRMFGFSSSKEMIEDVTDIGNQLYVNPDDRHLLIRMLQEQDRVEGFEAELYRKDRSKLWISINSHAVRDSNGNILYLEGTNTDITRRKLAEESLRQSEEKFSKAFHLNPSLMTISTLEDGTFVDVNRSFLTATGYNRDEVLGQTREQLRLWDHNDICDLTNALKTSGELHDKEVIFRIKSGELRSAWISASIIVISREPRVLVVGNDITEYKEAELALRESRRQLLNIIEFLPDATFVVDAMGKVIFWNKAMEEMTGMSKEDMLGKNKEVLSVAMYGQQRPILVDFLLRDDVEPEEYYDHLQKKGNTLLTEVPLLGNQSRGSSYISAVASPLLDTEGSIVGAIECIRDITEQKEIEATLQAREKALENKTFQLQEMNAALNVLLQKRADDQKELQKDILTNMKQIILPFLEKMKQSRLDETQQTYLAILESHLIEILSPFMKALSTRFSHLTPMEIQVVSLVRDGKTSKEIAQLLGMAPKTVSAHRYNLRSKLGLKKEKINLRSHLLSLQ